MKGMKILKIASYITTGAGIALNIVNAIIDNKMQEQIIMEKVEEIMMDLY